VRHLCHLRTWGLCLAAVFALGALGAGPALAAKSPYSTATWTQYKHCPYENPEVKECFLGRTAGGSKGGFFKLGGVTVKLNKPIIFQGGAKFNEPRTPHEEEIGQFFQTVYPAVGAETLESPELKVPGGINVITKTAQIENEWPQALKESFTAAKKSKEGWVNVKIELAGGNQLFEDSEALSTQNIINVEGTAFKLPLKVRLISPWLEKLGGGPCTIGNDEFPVTQLLTTAGAGRWGNELHFNEEFNNVELANSTLVDVGWSVPTGGGATGCGGEYEKEVNGALDSVLEVTKGNNGITVLTGSLYDASREGVEKAAEKGEL
jgi:hypothetical protein